MRCQSSSEILEIRVCSIDIREFKKRRRERLRHHHKSMLWLVELGKIIVQHVQHVRHAFWCNVLTWSPKWWLEMFLLEVLMTTQPRSSKSFIRCLYIKTIRVKRVKVYLLFCRTWPKRNNRKTFNLTQSSILGPDNMVKISPGRNIVVITCTISARAQNTNFREKVYWGAKTQSMRMLAFLFRPGLKFRFDYTRLFQIFRPVWPGWKS